MEPRLRKYGNVYLAVLSEKTSSPFALENDSVAISTEVLPEKSEKTKGKKEAKTLLKPIRKNRWNPNQFDGIGNRIISLPMKPAITRIVYCVDGKFIITKVQTTAHKAKVYLLNKKEEKELGSFNFAFSANNKKC
jgi:hypothetical protein